MTVQIDEALMKEAESLYDPSLTYHNFNHIHYVFAAADRIIERCRKNNVELDDDVVYLALLLHDAGFIEDHTAHGFDSKEAYSAHLAEGILSRHGYDAEVINKVKQAIASTHCDGRCSSNEDKVVKGADLSGLADSYHVFLDNAIKLKNEYEMMNGQTLDWQVWKDMAIDRLQLFLVDDMELTSDDYDEQGESLFQRAVTENIDRFRNEPVPGPDG